MVSQLFRGWIQRYFSNPQMLILWLLLISGVALVIFLGHLLKPVLVAIVLAYLLEGPIQFLQRHRTPRKVAVLVVFTLFVVGLLALLVILLPLVFDQLRRLLQQLPAMFAQGQQLLIQLPERYPSYITPAQIRQVVATLSAHVTGSAQQILSFSLASLRGVAEAAIYLLLVPLMAYFFLMDREVITEWLKGFLPDNHGLARKVWMEVNQQFANYVRGKMMEITLVGTVAYMVFAVIELDFAVLLALLTGLSVLVPYIGVTVVFLPVALVALFQWGATSSSVWAILAYGIIQLLDGTLLAPLLLSRVVNLHPVAVIVAVLVFGGLWGIVGLLFAIPLATLCQAVLRVRRGGLNA